MSRSSLMRYAIKDVPKSPGSPKQEREDEMKGINPCPSIIKFIFRNCVGYTGFFPSKVEASATDISKLVGSVQCCNHPTFKTMVNSHYLGNLYGRYIMEEIV